MKRDIYCVKCASEIREQYGIAAGSSAKIAPYAGEGLRVVDGTALKEYRCDSCYAFIAPKNLCAAVSFWKDGWPYSEWEPQYIDIKAPRAL